MSNWIIMAVCVVLELFVLYLVGSWAFSQTTYHMLAATLFWLLAVVCFVVDAAWALMLLLDAFLDRLFH